jgi:septation ring formation regulator EzrA
MTNPFDAGTGEHILWRTWEEIHCELASMMDRYSSLAKEMSYIIEKIENFEKTEKNIRASLKILAPHVDLPEFPGDA